MSKRKATPAEGIHLRHGKRCQSRDAVIVAGPRSRLWSGDRQM